ncbi:MAG: tRNA lysidine(34) synthetase TilS, partial [Oscillospiraceae bacterium]|nr:tRNA lysidine(34) synthetase TilS [Oscillospiraceae bacterium]
MNTDKILLFMEKHSMLPENGRIICAVSGGADSIMLLHYLSTFENLNIMAAHYNHHLRGEESLRDELFVKSFCEKLGVELFCGGGDVAAYAKEKGKSIEEAARELRYEFLHSLAEEQGAVVATAHNADDNGETVLLNLSRGTGLKGLCGIPPVRGEYIRPLLQMSRDEIESYLACHGLEHIEDSSNATDDYSRNRLRHHVSPILKEINPAFTENVSRMTESLREDEDYFQGEALRFLEENSAEDGSISAAAFMALHGSVRMRVLRIKCGGSLESVHKTAIENICLMRSIRAHADVPGMRVTREYDRLNFGAAENGEKYERSIAVGEKIYIPEGNITVSCEYVPKCAEINNSFNTFFFKSEN